MPDTLQRLRPFRYGDLAALARLMGEAGAWPTHQAPQMEELKARWTRRHVDPEAMIRVLPGPDGELIAFLQTAVFSNGSPRLSLECAVHPEWRRRGIGSALYRLALAKAQAEQVRHIVAPVFVLTGDENREGGPFLEKRGFVKQSAYWQMRLDRLVDQPEPDWPAGIQVRPFPEFPDAPPRWAALIRESFNEPADAEMVSRQIAEPGSSSQGYFFAVDTETGEPVGTSRARLDPAPQTPAGVIGYVGTVGVLPSYRRKGIAQALILQTVKYLHSQGAESAVLFVEERNSGARTLYESMGWHSVYRSDNYWKTLEYAGS